MQELYNQVCQECSEIITKRYSTSFSLGIRLFHKKFRKSIYSIYGFVRLADEIVDSFHNHNKPELLSSFRQQTFEAIEEKISLNPVIHSFQQVVNNNKIEKELIEAFLYSMEMDLDKTQYRPEQYDRYIYGSAEVVGLMCLRVFCEGNEDQYRQLKPAACKLGAAFQKVNFLRDLKSDYQDRGRIYFPGVNFTDFEENQKQRIEEDIKSDFEMAYQGILNLPRGTKLGVYLAYVYYSKLFNKIKGSSVGVVKEKRIRIPDFIKFYLLAKTAIRYKLSLL